MVESRLFWIGMLFLKRLSFFNEAYKSSEVIHFGTGL